MKRNRWRQLPFRELCDFQNGFAFKNSDYVEESISAYEVFRMGNIRKGGGFNPDGNKAFVSRTQGESLSRFVLKEGDILMCMTDMKASMALLGHTAWMPVSGRYLLNQRVGRITVRRTDSLDSRFLYYYSNSPEYISWLRAHANSGVQVNLSTEAILNSPISCPPLSLQKRIAGILSAYDDLIDVNRRRIALLEEMARQLFEEWFVRFRFPGCEASAMFDAPDRPVPEGWRQGKIGDFVEFKSGFPFKSSTFTDTGKHRIVTIRNVQDGSFNPATDSCIEQLPDKLPQHCRLADGDILLSLTDNVGRACIVYDAPFLLNQRLALLSPIDPADKAFTYCVFRRSSVRRTLEMASNGVAQQNLSPIVASNLPCLIPPVDLRARFSSFATPLFSEVVVLERANSRLAYSRDFLRPRLISGELSSIDERELEAVA